MWKDKGIVIKLSVSTLLGVAMILLIVLIYNYRISKNYILTDARKDALNLTELTINQIENVLNIVEKSPEELAFYLEHHGDKQKTESFLKNTIQRFQLIKGACIAFAPKKNGELVLYNAPYFYSRNDSVFEKNLADNNYNYWEKDWYRIPMNQNKAMWSEPYFDKGGGNVLMSTYSVPFHLNDDTVPDGVITVDISLKRLQNLVESIKIYDEGFAFLVSSNGNVITHPKLNLSNESVVVNLSDSIDNPEMLSLIQRMLNGESDFVALQDVNEKRHSRDWISFDRIPSNSWSIALIFNEADLYDEIEALTTKLIFIGIAGVILLALIIFFIARNITKPLIKLVQALRLIGKGDLNTSLPVRKSKDEIGLLGESFIFMQDELKKYIENLKRTTAEKEKIESEIKIASRIQRDMLPNEFKASNELQQIDLKAYLSPALEIGGDLYDYFIHPDGSLYFVIGDVSGKGVPAALFMSRTITLFRSIARLKSKVSEIAAEINKELCINNDTAMFVTMFIAKIIPGENEFTYCNAGHNPPLFCAEDKVSFLNTTHGTPVGIFEDIKYSESKCNFNEGDILLTYTDGVTEAENAQGGFYGDKRLKNTFERSISNKTEKIIKLLTVDVNEFVNGYVQSDDITLLIVRSS